MAHEVVAQVEVGDILTVKEIFRHLLQAVTGQVNHADCLRHHLRRHTGHQERSQNARSVEGELLPKSDKQADTLSHGRWTNEATKATKTLLHSYFILSCFISRGV